MTQLEPIDFSTTALVVIDLQNGIIARECEPYTSREVVQQAAKLVDAFRKNGGFVALVRVATSDGKDMLNPKTDQPASMNQVERPVDYSEIVPEIDVQPSDHVVTKHQWGAFYGTDLDLEFRRRGITTIVLCGIATGIGVDTTAREAFQHGYHQIFASDAMTGLSKQEHDYVLSYIFPRMGRIRTTEQILAAAK